MGEITPKAPNGNQYIIVAIDYFIKWEEAASYTKLEAIDVSKFIVIKQHHLLVWGSSRDYVRQWKPFQRTSVGTITGI